MKIVMLCEFYNGALEYQENLLVKYYTKHRHAVTVITSTFESVFDFTADRHDDRKPASESWEGTTRIIRLPYRFNFLHRIRAFERIDGILDQEAPDLIFVHDIMPNILEAIAYKERHPHCRMIMDYHADYSNSGKNWLSRKILHGVIRKWYLDRARRHLSRIFPVVPASATFLRDLYGVPESEMELLPLGADTDLAREMRARGEGRVLKARLGIPEGDRVILTGGRLAPAKRTELLVDAVLKIGDPSLNLVIIGDADTNGTAYKQALVDLASGRENIHFTGWLSREDVYRHLGMADLAVFPASQSIVWQQAIGAGVPLIVGDIGHQDVTYLNTHGNILVLGKNELNSTLLAAAILRVLSDQDNLRAMREGAMRVADTMLNWDNLIERTLRFNEKPHRA